MVIVPPNVRAKRATTAGRQARAGQNVPRTAYRQTGTGGLPLALRLSEGLGRARCVAPQLLDKTLVLVAGIA